MRPRPVQGARVGRVFAHGPRDLHARGARSEEGARGVDLSYPRVPLDIERYVESVRSQQSCFICEIVAGNDPRSHALVYEDDDNIAFLNRFPTLFGYTLVAPKSHVTDVTASFSRDAYAALQDVLYRVCEAVRLETGAERMYLLSLGSHQGNAHVHWHVAPLPPGTPYEMQQFEALRAENGVLRVPDEDQVAFAARVRERLASGAV